MKKIAIFTSGTGSNFKSIHNHILSGYIPAKISIVVSNNSDSSSIKYANENKIPIFITNASLYPDPDSREQLLIEQLLKKRVDFICLAGYLRLLPKLIVKKFNNRILNIHPSLLPLFGGKGFFGIKVHEAVIKSGAKESGITIHFVDEYYDTGKIIEQKKVKVYPNDTAETLACRILKIEHKFYPKIIKAFCENRILLNENSKVEVKN